MTCKNIVQYSPIAALSPAYFCCADRATIKKWFRTTLLQCNTVHKSLQNIFLLSRIKFEIASCPNGKYDFPCAVFYSNNRCLKMEEEEPIAQETLDKIIVKGQDFEEFN